MADKHAFSFFRAGGFDQVRFESGDDFKNLESLDLKLWVALACPTKGLAFDPRTLELIDANKDGRIRAPELLDAVKWTTSLLKDAGLLVSSPAELPLAAIDDATEEGVKLLAVSKTVLEGLGKGSAAALSVADMTEAIQAFDAKPFNGDGVITELSAPDDAGRKLIAEIVDCTGGKVDRGGKPGVDAEKITEFFGLVGEHVAWLAKGDADPATLPLKGETGAAFDALNAVRAKIDDYFTRCRLAAFDERAINALNREEEAYIAIAAKDLTITSEEIRAFPLAQVAAGRALPLAKGVNPAWSDALSELAAKVVKPLLGEKAALAEADWAELKRRFAPYEAWQGGKAGAAVEKLGAERLRELAKDGARKPLDALLEEEKKQEPTAQSIASVEKLVRLSRDLYRLVNNYVSFTDFYQRTRPAIFQIGRLYLDHRECQLCIRVDDLPKHATMSPLARAVLAYCDCTRPATGEKMTIAAAVTAGDSDNLMVGRNGVFFDNEGKDWDATIVRLVDNPISVRQAFWMPYKKLMKFIEEQISKRAAASEAKSSGQLTAGAESVGAAATTAPAAAAPAPKKLDIGIVAAIGVAVGGITAALGALLQAFFGLGIWMPLGVLGLLLLISGPSMLIAWLKLRQRNLGPLLDANGWAVNSRALLNVPLGGSLTKLAKLPKGAKVDHADPFATKRRPWKLYFVVLVVLALGLGWYFGKLDRFLPKRAQSVQVLGDCAPAAAKSSRTP